MLERHQRRRLSRICDGQSKVCVELSQTYETDDTVPAEQRRYWLQEAQDDNRDDPRRQFQLVLQQLTGAIPD